MVEKGQSCGPEVAPEETKPPGKEGGERPHRELNGGGAEGSTALGRLPECQAPRVSSSPVTSTRSWPGALHPRMRDQDQSSYSQGYVEGLLRECL